MASGGSPPLPTGQFFGLSSRNKYRRRYAFRLNHGLKMLNNKLSSFMDYGYTALVPLPGFSRAVSCLPDNCVLPHRILQYCHGNYETFIA
jgi:hypothetical protein